MHLRIAPYPHVFHVHTQRDLTPDHVSGQNLKDEEEPSPVTSEVAHHHRFSGRVFLFANLFADGLFPQTTYNAQLPRHTTTYSRHRVTPSSSVPLFADHAFHSGFCTFLFSTRDIIRTRKKKMSTASRIAPLVRTTLRPSMQVLPCRSFSVSASRGEEWPQRTPMGAYYESIINKPSPYPFKEKPEEPPSSADPEVAPEAKKPAAVEEPSKPTKKK